MKFIDEYRNVELGKKLAASTEAQSCAALKWFQYGFGRDYQPEQGDACTMERIKVKFAEGGYKFRSLLLALASSDAFFFRRVTPAAGGQ